MEETKVIYYIDDETTPYLVKIPLSTSQVTLRDFKLVLNKQSCNYKYFFKSVDDDFGEIKEEIVDESTKLPVDHQGRVKLWLVTADGEFLNSSLLRVIELLELLTVNTGQTERRVIELLELLTVNTGQTESANISIRSIEGWWLLRPHVVCNIIKCTVFLLPFFAILITCFIFKLPWYLICIISVIFIIVFCHMYTKIKPICQRKCANLCSCIPLI